MAYSILYSAYRYMKEEEIKGGKVVLRNVQEYVCKTTVVSLVPLKRGLF
jgi:hypothetical protein